MVRNQAARGEIWLVDLGLAQKTRPVVVLSVLYADNERAVVTYVARTTSARSTRFEVPHHGHGFKPGVFDAQSIGSIPDVKLLKRIGVIDPDTMNEVEAAVRAWLQL